jgi:hypothetical protein
VKDFYKRINIALEQSPELRNNSRIGMWVEIVIGMEGGPEKKAGFSKGIL